MSTESPNICLCVPSQSSSSFSIESSPSSRRVVWTTSSNRFIAICRKTVAIESSIRPASRLSLRLGSSSIASSRLKVSASPNTDAVSAVVSGRVRVEQSERLGEVSVQAVAELVGEREYRAPVAREVHEDVRVHARHVRRAERARALVLAHRRVDPALAEEALDDVSRRRPRSRRTRRERSAAPRPRKTSSGPRRSAPSGRRTPAGRDPST